MQLQLRPRIVPTGEKLPWLQARKAVKDKGGLPPHRLLDSMICDESYRTALPATHREAVDRVLEEKNGVWTRELYAHFGTDTPAPPDRGPVDHESEWVIVYDEFIRHVDIDCIAGQTHTGLLIQPRGFQATRDALGGRFWLVLPESIAVIQSAVDYPYRFGKFDPVTGMVLEAPEPIPELEKRMLWISDGEGIWPLSRTSWKGNSIVVHPSDPRKPANVSYVVYDILEEDTTVAEATLADIKKFAAGETPEALRMLKPAQLEAARELAKTLSF